MAKGAAVTGLRALYFDNPGRWIDRAEAMRTIAESMSGECRRHLITLAEQYYCMAELAQRRLDFRNRTTAAPVGAAGDRR